MHNFKENKKEYAWIKNKPKKHYPHRIKEKSFLNSVTAKRIKHWYLILRIHNRTYTSRKHQLFGPSIQLGSLGRLHEETKFKKKKHQIKEELNNNVDDHYIFQIWLTTIYVKFGYKVIRSLHYAPNF